MASTAASSELMLFRRAVDEYCRDCGIEDGEERRCLSELAAVLVDHGRIGVTDFRRELEGAIGPSALRRALAGKPPSV